MIRALLSRNILPTHERSQKVIMFECRFLKKHAFHASLSLVGPPDKQYSIKFAVVNLPFFKISFYHSFVLQITVFKKNQMFLLSIYDTDYCQILITMNVWFNWTTIITVSYMDYCILKTVIRGSVHLC